MSYELTTLKGVGEKKAVELNNLGIFSLKELIDYYPRTYEVIGDIKSIKDAKQNQKELIKCNFVEAQMLLLKSQCQFPLHLLNLLQTL